MTLRRGDLLPLAVCGMESAWLSTLAGWLTGQTGSGLPAPLVFAAVLAAAFSTRWLLGSRLPLSEVRLYAVASAGITLLVVVRVWYYPLADPFSIGWIAHAGSQATDFFRQAPRLGLGLFVGAFAWYRGVTVGRSSLSGNDVPVYFIQGSIALVVLSLVRAAWPAGETSSGTAQVLLFFGCGLTALALSRLRDVASAAGEAPPALQRRWLGVLLASAGATLGLAVIATGVLAIQSLGDLTRLAGQIVSFVLLAFIVATLPVVWIAEYLVYGLRWLLALLGVTPPPEPPQLPEPPNRQELEERQEAAGLPPDLLQALQLGFVVLIIAVAALLLALAVFRRRQEDETGDPEERESLWSWQAAWDALRAALKGFWARLTTKLGVAGISGDSGATKSDPTEPSTRTVREIYRAFLQWTAQRGLARRSQQTPSEYLTEITRRLGGQGVEVAVITRVYMPARYGAGPVSEAEMEEAQSAWARLRETPQPP